MEKESGLLKNGKSFDIEKEIVDTRKDSKDKWCKEEAYTLKIACCDCGLVHDIIVRLIDKNHIKMDFFRNNYSTGQIRRHRKNSK